MNLLVFNSGSSSIKFSLFETSADAGSNANAPTLLLDGEPSGLHTPNAVVNSSPEVS